MMGAIERIGELLDEADAADQRGEHNSSFNIVAAAASLIDIRPATDSRSPGNNVDAEEVDPALLRAASRGDAAATKSLLDQIRPMVVRYCRARIGRQESFYSSADDVAQEVMLAIVSALPQYRLSGRSFMAFVYGVSAHKVTDAFRAISRGRAEPVANFADMPDVSAADPSGQEIAVDLRSQFGGLMTGLTTRQRLVIELRILHGMSADEVAQAIGSTPGAVRVTQHRALVKIRKNYDEVEKVTERETTDIDVGSRTGDLELDELISNADAHLRRAASRPRGDKHGNTEMQAEPSLDAETRTSRAGSEGTGDVELDHLLESANRRLTGLVTQAHESIPANDLEDAQDG